MSSSELRTAIDEAAESFVGRLEIVTLQSLADPVIEAAISNLNQLIDGHAIAIWLPENRAGEAVLTIAYNVGERGHEIEGVVSQSLGKGLVSKAYRDHETICHQGFFKHRDQSIDVDQKLGQVTAHQIATPFQLFDRTVGAATIIQTLASGIEKHSEWGFDERDVDRFQAGIETIQRLFELNIIRQLA